MSTISRPEQAAGAGGTAGAARAESETSGWVPMAVAVGLLLPAFGVFFYNVLWKQARLSYHAMEDWGHAFFVPLISLYLIWQCREAIARTAARVYWPGIVAVAFGMLSYVFGILIARNHMVQGLSAVVTIFGVVLTLLGPAMMRYLFLPIGYLVFAITLPDQVMIDITFKLQQIAAHSAYVLLNLAQIETDISGNVLTILTGDGKEIPLNVAEQCSGMRMVIAFVALGAAVALVASREWWQRVIVLAMSVPVAIGLNVLRVAVLGVASLVDPELATGEAHTLIGTLLLIPGFFFYLGIVWVLNRCVKDEQGVKGKVVSTQSAAAGQGLRLSRVNWRSVGQPAVIGLVVVFVAGGVVLGKAIDRAGLYLTKYPIYAPGGRLVREVPSETVSWVQVGEDDVVSKEIMDEFGTENYLTRRYVLKETMDGDAPKVVELHLAYYTGMIDTVPHVPERCMVGGGWHIQGGTQVVPIGFDVGELGWRIDRLASDDMDGTVHKARLSYDYSDAPGTSIRLPIGIENATLRTTTFVYPGAGDDRTRVAGYFFIANGEVASSAADVRTMAFDLTDNYAYYMKVQVSAVGLESADELGVYGGSLLGELLPEICRAVPDWVLVRRGEYPVDKQTDKAVD